MAIGSLTKFTVPLPTDQSSSNQGLLMPKLQYRFRVMFENFGVSKPTTELTKQVMSASRPNFDSENLEIWVYNSRINLNGRPKWKALDITIRDDVLGSVAKLIGEQVQRQFDFYEQASAATGQDYKFTTKIEMLDGGNGTSEPVVLEMWECYGCFIMSVDYNATALEYKSQEPMSIKLAIQPDNCLQLIGGIGSKNPTPRGVGGTLATAGASLPTGI